MKSDLTGSQKDIILNIGIKDANSVLDVGCGNGEKTFYVSQNVKRAVGIDPDNNMILAAKAHYDRENLDFQIGQAESLQFPSSYFDSVLFNESFHHIPCESQLKAIIESYRVLETKGKLLITEPIYGSGSFEMILKLYNDEKDARENAIRIIKNSNAVGFKIVKKFSIRIEYSCKGFDDLYQNNIKTKPYAKWNDSDKDHIIDILDRCDKTYEGDSIIDYFATVWLLIKG